MIAGPTAGEADFLSAARLGDPPFGKELDAPELHDSVSFWRSAKSARSQAAHHPGLGSHMAQVVVSPHLAATDVAIHPTPNQQDHADVWAQPRLLRQLVKRVFPIDQRKA
ncbi:MAG: hypothetical protein ACYDAG_09940 [Chloroflexota bacterium]